MKSKIRFWQEIQPDGSIADSWIRALSCLSFILLCIYLWYSLILYRELFSKYTDMVTAKVISDQTYVALTMQLKQVDELVFWVLVLLTAAPKVIQKFAETWVNKTGSSSSTSTSTSEKTTQTN